jgi:hypothetical protein
MNFLNDHFLQLGPWQTAASRLASSPDHLCINPEHSSADAAGHNDGNESIVRLIAAYKQFG